MHPMTKIRWLALLERQRFEQMTQVVDMPEPTKKYTLKGCVQKLTHEDVKKMSTNSMTDREKNSDSSYPLKTFYLILQSQINIK